jgi:hypothetical protein
MSQLVRCPNPNCGRDVCPSPSCPLCGHPLTVTNGTTAAPIERVPIAPELLEWARTNFDEEEFLAGLREVEQTGGATLDDFIEELQRRTQPRE